MVTNVEGGRGQGGAGEEAWKDHVYGNVKVPEIYNVE